MVDISKRLQISTNMILLVNCKIFGVGRSHLLIVIFSSFGSSFANSSKYLSLAEELIFQIRKSPLSAISNYIKNVSLYSNFMKQNKNKIALQSLTLRKDCAFFNFHGFKKCKNYMSTLAPFYPFKKMVD